MQSYFYRQKIAIKVIKSCRKTSAHKFGTKLGLRQYDIILTKNNQC